VSRRVDEERKEESAEARLEVAKERLRFAQQVLAAWVDGSGPAATALRLGCSRCTVWRARVWLGVADGGSLEAAKERLRLAQSALTAWVDEADARATALRLGKSVEAVTRVWAWLGVTSAHRGPGRKNNALPPRASVASIREVQP